MMNFRTLITSLAIVNGSAAWAIDESATFLAILASEHPREVRLGTLDVTGADLLDLSEGWLEFPPGECLALVRTSPWRPGSMRSKVVLQDGQMFPGRFVFGDDSQLAFSHLWLLDLEIPLDRVAQLELIPGTPIPPGDSDRVVLLNGDVLEGFVDEIGDMIIIEIEDGDRQELVEIPVDRVAAIAFEGESAPASYPQVWTIDGLRMSLPRAGIDSSGKLAMQEHEFMTGNYDRFPSGKEIVALVMDGTRFTPLAATLTRTLRTNDVRRVAPSPVREDPLAPLGLTNLEMTGPARFEFTLPVGASRLRAGLKRGRDAMRWPAPMVSITCQDEELWRGTADDAGELDLDLLGRRGPLVIEILCGEQGPVHCSSILVNPIIYSGPVSRDRE